MILENCLSCNYHNHEMIIMQQHWHLPYFDSDFISHHSDLVATAPSIHPYAVSLARSDSVNLHDSECSL